MSDIPPHLKPLEEIEREGISDLVEVLHKEGLDAVRHVLWEATGWHKDYSPPAWRYRDTDEQKRIGWGMALRIEKILCTVLHEAHDCQVEGTMEIVHRAKKPSTAVTWTAKGGIAPKHLRVAPRSRVNSN